MYIGIDVGGTNIKFGIVTKEGKIVTQGKIPTIHEKEKFLHSLVQVIQKLQQNQTILGVGICAPGIIQKNGLMVTAGSIKPLYGINLKEEIQRRIDIPVFVENDANAAAIAEKWQGQARFYNNYLCIVLGTGMGGGIVINNQVYRGAHGMAGEFGWMLIDSLPNSENVETVSLNQRGAIVGGLCNQYQLAREEVNINHPVDALEIFEMERKHDEVATLVVERFFQDLSIGLVNLISSFDPEAILIGGAISENKMFMTRLNHTVEQLIVKHESLNFLNDKRKIPILPAKLKNDAGLIGAVYQVAQEVDGLLRVDEKESVL
jgi:beta-glucoside kinase